VLASAILVATCCANLPENDIQHLTDEIRLAENNLSNMLTLESKEEKQMNDMGTSIEEFENEPSPQGRLQTQALVQHLADGVEQKAGQASFEETRQQQAAQKALTEVSDAVEQLQQAGYPQDPNRVAAMAPATQKKGLGEGAGEYPVDHAMAKLQKVQSVLAQGTKTMHTKARLDRMAKEAQAIKELATQPSKGLPFQQPSVTSGGAISALKQASPSLGESFLNDGVISALKQASSLNKLEQPSFLNKVTESDRKNSQSLSLVQKETKDFDKLLKQEKSVFAAEEKDESQIKNLMKDLD
jgi:hypothetical protein